MGRWYEDKRKLEKGRGNLMDQRLPRPQITQFSQQYFGLHDEKIIIFWDDEYPGKIWNGMRSGLGSYEKNSSTNFPRKKFFDFLLENTFFYSLVYEVFVN